MDWLKKKKKKKKKEEKEAQAYDEKQRLIRVSERVRERGAKLLEDLIECCDGKSNPIKFFSADQILEATDIFSESKNLSQFGNKPYNWYSGKNENHNMILIKTEIFFILKETCRDILISSMVSGHKNFLKLVGCCLDYQHSVLVYDGVKKHSELDLSKQPWKRRMKIAEDISTALAYLHTAFPRPFVYSNMNLENILLDEDGVAKLCDFSYCISIPEGETFVATSKYDYKGYSFAEPNFVENGVVSEKTDAFGIGMLMQKLLSGEERFRDLCLEGKEVELIMGEMSETFVRRDFPNWLSNSMEERSMEEIADPGMLEEMGEISEEERCRMKAFLMLSQRCIGLRGEVPTMVEVAKELKRIQRSCKNDSSSPSGKTRFDSAQDISSSSSQARLQI